MLKRVRNIMYVIGIVVLICVNVISVKSEEADEDKSVLFISSYNAGFPTLPAQLDGINSFFQGKNVVLDIDYMDTKEHNNEIHYENYYNFLKARLNDGADYDVVMVGDDNGLQFLMDHQEDLFPSTPIVFFCINDIERAEKANEMGGMTGIIEAISLEDNIELAQELFPDSDKFIGIVDNTNTGIGDAATFSEIAGKYSDVKFELVNVSSYTFKDFETVLTDIPSSDVVFYLSMFEDQTGESISIDQAVEIITDNVKAPVFRMSIGGVGDGLLGGKMVSYEEQGRMAAEMAMAVVNGSDVDTLSLVSESPNKHYFDYEVMKKHGLSMGDVPEDSIIINEPSNFFTENRDVVIPGILVIGTMGIFIFILFYNNRKLKLKDKELRENNIEITSLYEESAATEEELRIQYDQILLSERKLLESEERYRILAYTDALTSLNNRESMMIFLDEKVKEFSETWLLIYMDLDNFKYINDTRGHEIGDQVLIHISKRLMEYDQELLYLCRLSGDEFVLVIDKDDKNIDIFIQGLMRRIEEAIDIGSATFYMTCSIGIADFPTDGSQKDVLLRRADMAMYNAKLSGKNRYSFFEKSMEIAASEKLMVQSRIRHALEYAEFELFYQPQMDMISGKMTGVEALIRWRDANGLYISPGLFIPMAEDQGIIHLIGLWVYEEAARNAKMWKEKYDEPLVYSVNVSAAEIIDHGFAASFLAILDKYDIEGSQVAIEVTENIFLDSKGKAVAQLHKLREEGIEIHLDDFGSGYSSLNYLINFPLDVVKIDRQFIKDIVENKKYQDMSKFIIDISHRLDLKVIAEGIETKEQMDFLKEINCNLLQGYYYARPMPFHELENFYNR